MIIIAYKQSQSIATYFSMQELHFTQEINTRLERYTVSLLIISGILIISWLCLFTRTVSYIEMDMDTIGIGTLIISVYKSYGAVLFKGAARVE